MIERFTKIVNGQKLLTIFAKCFISKRILKASLVFFTKKLNTIHPFVGILLCYQGDTFGMLQGPVLSSPFFFLYFNDLQSIAENSFMNRLADDRLRSYSEIPKLMLTTNLNFPSYRYQTSNWLITKLKIS